MHHGLIILFILAKFTFIACGTVEVTSLTQNSNDDIQKKDLASLTNKDFIQVKPKVYIEYNDYITKAKSTKDVLISEVYSKDFFNNIKRSFASNNKSNDIMNKLLSECYEGNSDSANYLMDKSYSRYKKNPSYWNIIGTCELLKNNIKKALIFYNRSNLLKGSEGYAPAINNLGVIYERKGMDQKALNQYKKASKLASFSYTPSFNMANLYLKYSFINKAQPILIGLYSRSPKDPAVISGMAFVSLLNGDYARAIKYYSSLDEKFHHLIGIGGNYALALYFAGKRKKALSIFDDIEDLNDKSTKRMISFYKKVSRRIRR